MPDYKDRTADPSLPKEGNAESASAFARSRAVLVVEGRLLTDPQWRSGPFPFEYSGQPTDGPARATYFSSRVARALYGPRRSHRVTQTLPDRPRLGTARLQGLEALQFAPFEQDVNTLFAVHVELPPEPDATMHALEHLSRIEGPDHPVRRLLSASTEDTGTVANNGRAHTSILMTPGPQGLPLLPEWDPDYRNWTASERWLWLGASATPLHRYPPPPATREELFSSALWLSADWRSLVLRDGVAFLGERADLGVQDSHFNWAELHFRSIYLDALLLGAVQRLRLHGLADELAGLGNPAEHPSRLAELEEQTSTFRNVFWWQHVTGHGIANDILRAYQTQHRLPELAQQVVNELSDYSRQAQTAAAERTNALLAVVTVLGLPVGGAIGICQALNQHSLGFVIGALVIAGVISALIFRAGPGRQVVKVLFPSLTRNHVVDKDPEQSR